MPTLEHPVRYGAMAKQMLLSDMTASSDEGHLHERGDAHQKKKSMAAMAGANDDDSQGILFNDGGMASQAY